MKLCGFEVGNDQPIFLIAGTCVVESEQMTLDTAGALKEICGDLGLPFIYKSSFDKANRSSRDGFRGPGMEEGLRILSEVKKQLDIPILTDVHEDTPMDEVLRYIAEHKYSRYPVYRKGINEISGVLYYKDLMGPLARREGRPRAPSRQLGGLTPRPTHCRRRVRRRTGSPR